MRTAFLAIHRTFPGNLGEEMIPLSKDPGRTVSYEHLLRMEAAGELSYWPEGARAKYSVPELLGGVETVEDRIVRQLTGRMPEVARAMAQLRDHLESEGQGSRKELEAVESAVESAGEGDVRKTAGYLKWLDREGKGAVENVTSQVITSLLRGY